MALKKFRFFVGACGPTMMYSNIIRAEDEVSAIKQYISAYGRELTEEEMNKYLRLIREVIPKENPDKLLDYMEHEIAVGDEVVFIRNSYGKPPKLLTGIVDKISAKSIVVKTLSEECFRVILPEDETEILPKVIVMNPRPNRIVGKYIDATGYPLQEGDIVAYMGKVYVGNCEGFRTGAVKKITEKTVEVEDTRKNFDRVVVINW